MTHQSLEQDDFEVSLICVKQGIGAQGATCLDCVGLLKVYIRNPEDFERIRQSFEAEISAEIPRIYLQGDICRENLLTEIDGIVACERVTPASP